VLPGTDLAQAAAIAEACRACVEAMAIPHAHSKVHQVVTLSAGVATMIPDSEISRRSLIAAADKALYQAKREGRNRVLLGGNSTVKYFQPFSEKISVVAPPC